MQSVRLFYVGYTLMLKIIPYNICVDRRTPCGTLAPRLINRQSKKSFDYLKFSHAILFNNTHIDVNICFVYKDYNCVKKYHIQIANEFCSQLFFSIITCVNALKLTQLIKLLMKFIVNLIQLYLRFKGNVSSTENYLK